MRGQFDGYKLTMEAAKRRRRMEQKERAKEKKLRLTNKRKNRKVISA